MTCAKTTVTARLTTATGATYIGTNACRRPQLVCPRPAAGHGRDQYALCATVCDQPAHAEVAAVRAAHAAGARLAGSVMQVDHHRVCPGCAALLRGLGVRWVVTEPQPQRRRVCWACQGMGCLSCAETGVMIMEARG